MFLPHRFQDSKNSAARLAQAQKKNIWGTFKYSLDFQPSLTISNGDWWILVQGAMSKIFVGAIVLLVVLQCAAWLLGFRRSSAAKLP